MDVGWVVGSGYGVSALYDNAPIKHDARTTHTPQLQLASNLPLSLASFHVSQDDLNDLNQQGQYASDDVEDDDCLAQDGPENNTFSRR